MQNHAFSKFNCSNLIFNFFIFFLPHLLASLKKMVILPFFALENYHFNLDLTWKRPGILGQWRSWKPGWPLWHQL